MINQDEFLYGNETYKLRGVLFATHTELGRFAKEKQYADKAEERFKLKNIPYVREQRIGDIIDIPDFIVWDLIVVEFKAKPFLQREDFEQVQRYLHQTNLKLGILVNFRSKYLKPQRILNINHLQISVKSDKSVDRNNKL
jgi:GxxExxY protein